MTDETMSDAIHYDSLPLDKVFRSARRNTQHRDYRALNDSSDDEAPPEDRVFKKSCITTQSTVRSYLNNEPVMPGDYISQLLQSTDSADMCSTNESALNSFSEMIFSWWKAHKGKFPQMAAAARKYLAIPASKVAVERLFNTGRDLIRLRRYALSAETMRQSMLLRSIYN
ncbi:hypothetical protein GcC1_047036 [Golovinomyces cichoracearum]|uniref:HAT C-terminal dimerisation domain-containing protein n=1 Tax=Golovinomyces cichoracearum TaxID=62708 RepID=A0A420IY37_9PEZI|nr:hypothetical protein GcC1_047036 [Golovinomyces cichoracearum]